MEEKKRAIVKDGLYKIIGIMPFVVDGKIRTSKSGNKYNFGSLAVFVEAGDVEGLYWANDIVVMFKEGKDGRIDFKNSSWFPKADTEAQYICDMLSITKDMRGSLKRVDIPRSKYVLELSGGKIISIYQQVEL